ncbi:hypothetical protein RB653_000203 [Dictyostelium firmibasis]|uniref:Transmembrane protein n=1 Tax=Dictyostelium firmibasis TaxID=79012 RepID=A0AAN7Z103_9MYCE
MSLIQKDTIFTFLKITYGVAAITSPLWASMAFMALTEMHYRASYYRRARFQKACQVCILAEPVALIYSLYKWDKSTFVTFLPLLPIASFIVCSYAYLKDIKGSNN